MKTPPSPFNRILTIMLLFLGITIVYSGTIDNPLVWDDTHLIEQNLFIQNSENFKKVFTREYFTQPVEISYRPIATMSYMLNYAMWETQPAGWRFFNIAIHLINAMLVFALAASLLGRPWLATAVSLIFALHPAQTEAINGVTFRDAPMCLMFLLFSLLAFISARGAASKSRGAFSLAASFAFFFAALFTKETAVVFPAAIFAYVYFLENKRGFSSSIKSALPFMIPTAIYLFIRFGPMRGPAESYISHGDGLTTFILMLQAWAGYITILLWPAKLCVEHAFSETPGILDASTLSAAFALIASSLCAILIVARNRAAGFGVAWFILILLPVSNIIPIGAVMSERYIYIAAPGFLIVVAAALKELFLSENTPYPALSRIFVSTLLCAAIIASGVAAKNRNAVWDTEVSFWENAHMCAPVSAKVLVNLGIAYMNEDRLDDAKRALTLAVRFASDGSLTDIRYGSLYRALTNLGIVYAREGRSDSAVGLLSASAKLNPNSEYSHFNLGVVYLRAGMPEEAEKAFLKGLELQPNNISARFYMVGIFHFTGRLDEALSECERIIELSPGNQRAIALKNSLISEIARRGEISH